VVSRLVDDLDAVLESDAFDDFGQPIFTLNRRHVFAAALMSVEDREPTRILSPQRAGAIERFCLSGRGSRLVQSPGSVVADIDHDGGGISALKRWGRRW
jgi:hypothetical protein